MAANARVAGIIKEMPYHIYISFRRYMLINFDSMRERFQNTVSGSVTYVHEEDGWHFNLADVSELEELLRLMK